MSRCGLVILAAGSGSRMGQAKQLLKLDGVSLLRRCAQTALATQCRPIVVVLGAGAAELRAEVADLEVTVLINTNWASGMGTSIRLGAGAMAALSPIPDAVALLLCDQPLITAIAIQRLVSAQAESGKLICAAAYSGTLGTPAVFAASLLGELAALGDAQGGKVIISRHAAGVLAIDLPEAAMDVDTPADFDRLRAQR